MTCRRRSPVRIPFRRLPWVLVVSLALAFEPWPARAQSPGDADLALGVGQVEEGDFEAGVITLDGVVRRLGKDKSRSQELARAYLYLGIAYLGLGQEATARAQFLETVKRAQELKVDPQKFPPNIVEAFEQVKRESAAGAAPDPPPSPAPPRATTPGPAPPTAPPAKGGGGKKLLLIGLGGAAVAGGAVALAGGGAASGSSASGRVTSVFTGSVVGGQPAFHTISLSTAGLVELRIDSITPSDAPLQTCPLDASGVAVFCVTTPGRFASGSLQAGSHRIVVATFVVRQSSVGYRVSVTHPR